MIRFFLWRMMRGLAMARGMGGYGGGWRRTRGYGSPFGMRGRPRLGRMLGMVLVFWAAREIYRLFRGHSDATPSV